MDKKNNWTAPNLAKNAPASLVPDESLDVEFVILLQGANLFGDAVYSYLQLTGRHLKDMFGKMQAGENFKPSDFGAVLAAGRGQPPQEVREEMAATYNMIDVPMPQPVAKPVFVQPKFFNDDES